MSKENVDSMRAALEALNRGDFEGAVADFAPDFEYIPSGGLPDTEGSYRGPDQFKRFMSWLTETFDDPHQEPNEFIDLGDVVGDEGEVVNRVIVSVTNSGRGKASGVETTWNVWLLWTIRDGRSVLGQGFMSKAEALEAAGLR